MLKRHILQNNQNFNLQKRQVENMKFLDLINNSFLVRQVLSDKEEVQICYKKKELDEKENQSFCKFFAKNT